MMDGTEHLFRTDDRVTVKIAGLRSLENPAVPLSEADYDSAPWLYDAPDPSGMRATARTADRMAAVAGSVRLIAETLGALPFGTHRETSPSIYVRLRHRVDGLLQNPNPALTGQVWIEQQIQAHLTYGANYDEIVRDPLTGEELELWPLPPERTKPVLKNRELVFETYDDDGRPRVLLPDEVVHVPRLPLAGTITGRSPFIAGKNAVGLGLAAETHGSRILGAGLNAPGTIEVPGKLNDEQFDKLATRIKAARKSKSGELLILEGGLVYKEGKGVYDLAQYLGLRSFQVLEVARILGVPPLMLGEADKGAPKSSVEEQERDLVKHTLRPIAKRFGAALSRSLFGRGSDLSIRWDFRELLQADQKTAWETFVKGKQFGIVTTNEVRGWLNLPGVGAAGDKLYVPMNLDVMRTIDGALRRILDDVGEIERGRLLEASGEGDDALVARSERLYADLRTMIVRRLDRAGDAVVEELLRPAGQEADIDRWRDYARALASSHCERARKALAMDPAAWIAGGRLEYDPAEAAEALFKRNGGNGQL